MSQKNKRKRSFYIKSVFDFWRIFCQNGQDRAPKNSKELSVNPGQKCPSPGHGTPIPRRLATLFHNEHTNIIISEPDKTPEECRKNLKHICTIVTLQYCNSRRNNQVFNTTSYDIHSSEQTLPRHMRTTLAQLRANKSPLHTKNSYTYILQCLLCLTQDHATSL